jgi:hypothetical protein
LAVAVAIASTATVAVVIVNTPRASADGAAALAPDLVTLPFHKDDLFVGSEKGKRLLRLSNEVGNIGSGPLEIFPSESSSDCDGDGDPANDRDAAQRLFEDSNGSGVYELGVDGVAAEQGVGCMRYHPRHDHWHVLDFTQYQLRREADAKLVRQSQKIGFCLTDARPAVAVAGSPAAPVYPLEQGALIPCDAGSTQGISVGWADEYALALPGQQLDVSRLEKGRYCLSSRVDPSNLLAESDDLNNVRRVRLLLDPDELRVRKLSRGCRIGR